MVCMVSKLFSLVHSLIFEEHVFPRARSYYFCLFSVLFNRGTRKYVQPLCHLPQRGTMLVSVLTRGDEEVGKRALRSERAKTKQ